MTAKFHVTHDCGFETTVSTQVYAERSLQTHSCEKWRAKTEAAARRIAAEAAIDRTPKPCLHKYANHQHGTNPCYVLDKCRCLPCMKARGETDSQRRRQQAYGRYDKYVDAEPIRAHMRTLMDSGIGLKRIAKLSGVSTGVLWKLIYGKRRPDGTRTPTIRVTRPTANRILAITPQPQLLADGAKIDGTGTRRRLRALIALGYSINWLARELGMSNVWRTIHSDRFGDGTVIKATADAVRALYDAYSMHPHQPADHRSRIAASRARTLARVNGWLPPLAWDDDHIDDPTYEPQLTDDSEIGDLDDVVIERAMAGDRRVVLTTAERYELVRRWVAAGKPLNELERRTGINARRYLPVDEERSA